MILMKIQVFDTYVKSKAGETMHFDVFMPEGKSEDEAIEAATKYLGVLNEHGQITSKECSFCHIQEATPEQEKGINDNGYFIYKMSSNCP